MTVDNFDAAVGFYRDALGLAQLADWSSDDGRVVLFEAGRRGAGTVRLALEVDDVDATALRVVAAGGDQVAAAVVTPWGDRNARVRSPDGLHLTLFSKR